MSMGPLAAFRLASSSTVLMRGIDMKSRNKTNRLKAMLKRKNVKSSLRKSKGERKYPT
jgi:hypothetical protein